MVQGRNTHWNMTGSKLLRPTTWIRTMSLDTRFQLFILLCFIISRGSNFGFSKDVCFFFVGRMVRITHSHSRGYLKKWWIPKSPWLFFTLCHGRLCWMMNWGCPNDLGNPWNPPFGQCSGRSLAMLKAEAKTRRECDAATRSGDMSNQNWIWI